MNKLPLTKEEIERLLIVHLQTFPDCEGALEIVVIPIEDCSNAATWTVQKFNYGKSDGDACDRALQHIVPGFQRVYDLVCKH
jgi:hypothetical protein